jgi:hypothetical protein
VTPNANTLVVHAVLDPGAQHQIIVVQTTTGAVAQQRQVAGAVVTIATPDGRTLTAVQRIDTVSVAPSVPFPKVTTIYDLDVGAAGLTPGGTYQLRVVAPDGRTVTGRTTIPNAVPSTAAAPRQTIDRTRDTVSLQWSRVAGARSYQVVVRSSAGAYSLFAGDTSVALPGTAQDVNAVDWCADVREGYVPPDVVCQAFVRGLTHQLAVIAVDGNYFDYYRRPSDTFTGAGLVMHLDGGIGVFGSAVTVATRTIVVR